MKSSASLTSAQIRAARAILRWSASDLARQSSLGVNTIRRAEIAEENISLTAANELAIRRALEAAGVEFTNGDQPGVRVRSIGAARDEKSTPATKVLSPARMKRRIQKKSREI
jgi:transcriptional regulator with XRE-family HTH domain